MTAAPLNIAPHRTAPHRARVERGVAVLLGVVLIVVALAKFAGSRIAPVDQTGWLSSPRLQFAVAVFEIGLGAWLLSGRDPVAAWLLAVVVFSTFLLVSGHAGWIGVANCGCLGVIKASPWVAFGIDAAALTLLAIGRPTWDADARAAVRRATRQGVTWTAGIVASLLLIWGAATWWYGSSGKTLATLRGERLTIDRSFLDFGSVAPGTMLPHDVALTNWTETPIRVIGGTADCSCVTTDDLPVTVRPGETATLRVRYTVPQASAGRTTRVAKLITDSPEQPSVRLRLSCRVE